jgi:hypothetical protein
LDYRETQIKILEAIERNTHTKTSSSVKYSGATIPRKKPLGSVGKIFEIITHTYLLAFSKLEGELHLKGVSL